MKRMGGPAQGLKCLFNWMNEWRSNYREEAAAEEQKMKKTHIGFAAELQGTAWYYNIPWRRRFRMLMTGSNKKERPQVNSVSLSSCFFHSRMFQAV